MPIQLLGFYIFWKWVVLLMFQGYMLPRSLGLILKMESACIL
jgi:hypothetical protein